MCAGWHAHDRERVAMSDSAVRKMLQEPLECCLKILVRVLNTVNARKRRDIRRQSHARRELESVFGHRHDPLIPSHRVANFPAKPVIWLAAPIQAAGRENQNECISPPDLEQKPVVEEASPQVIDVEEGIPSGRLKR